MKVSIKAQAKINLSLDILGKLPNGYHSVQMVMQSIPLCDTVDIEETEGDGIELICEKEGVPTDSRNTAYKAAQLFLDKTEIRRKIKITLHKQIPAAAGMAGGSTDAAAVLKGLNQLFNEPLDKEEALELCVKIGADVPFCFLGGCALCEGIGEVLTPIAPLENAYLVIAKPKGEVSTKWVYENFKMEKVSKHPNTQMVIEAVKMGDLKALCENTANVLETVTQKEYPIIGEYKEKLSQNGAVVSMMSGSGPTVFGIFDNEEKAKMAFEVMKPLTNDTFLIKI